MSNNPLGETFSDSGIDSVLDAQIENFESIESGKDSGCDSCSDTGSDVDKGTYRDSGSFDADDVHTKTTDADIDAFQDASEDTDTDPIRTRKLTQASIWKYRPLTL